jgi:MoaA/NifB/PqqE/SkfB family radical SAM enzyme
VYSPYGFDGNRASVVRNEPTSATIQFGFLGRVIPVKGIHLLLNAFRATRGDARLRIHGGLNGQEGFLRAIAGDDQRIEFRGAYDNDDLSAVLSGIDAVVVPSLWIENAPLVIQESKLAGIPVITSDAGGMAELVLHGVDGYVFPLGDEPALTHMLQGLIDEPEKLRSLRVDHGAVREIADDALGCLRHYRSLCAPRRITVVTNPGLCNLNCPMCDTHSVHAPRRRAKDLPMLEWAVVESTLRDLARLGLQEVIPSTMGEPLMYPSFDRLLALLQELGLTLNLTTNGTWPRGGVEWWAPRILPVLSDVKISLNGVDAAVNQAVMVGVNTERQLADVETFVRMRDRYAVECGRSPTVTLQATFMEANLDALPDLVNWAAKLGVDRFKGHHLWVTWDELKNESLRRNSDAARRWNAIVRRLREIAASVEGPSGRRIRLDNVEPLDEGDPTGPPADTECPFLGREAWLEADGSFQVCCCPSEKRKAFGNFGNVKDQAFARLWSSPTYREFVASWGDHPNCRNCNMRKPRGSSSHG